MKNHKKSLGILFYLALFMVMLTSCFSNKRISLFNNLGEMVVHSAYQKLDENLIDQATVLKITVNNIDQQSSTIINTNNIDGTYLIGDSGTIDFPFIGKIKVIGKSKTEIKNYIEFHLVKNKIGISPLVNVRITNFHITILGEVNKPGLFVIPEEQITLPEALGISGDLTPYAKRSNVLIIREFDGKRTTRRINLNDSAIFNPAIYNLKSKDIIYIEPNYAKSFTTTQSRAILGFVTGILTLIFLFTRIPN